MASCIDSPRVTAMLFLSHGVLHACSAHQSPGEAEGSATPFQEGSHVQIQIDFNLRNLVKSQSQFGTLVCVYKRSQLSYVETGLGNDPLII